MIGTFASRGLVLSAALCGMLAWPARPARACGGFFCNQTPPSGLLPIAQAGENVLFVLDKGTNGEPARVEAHIQIIYKGDAAQFSWIVPVTALPELDVGTDVLFDRIELATRPSYQFTWTQDGTCQGQSSGGGVGCGGVTYSAAGGGAKEAGGVVNGPRVDVLFRGNVGPYESVVIRSDDPAALKMWLTTKGYFVAPESEPIIDEYVAAHAFFVALRLQQGQDTTAIRPIVLRMAGDEGCLPLKLTSIAATPDLRANVWVLGDARAVPLDYVEIGINQAKLDWFGGGANYDKLLGEAANEAGGNAFAVEYAMPTAPLAPQLLATQSQIDGLRLTSNRSAYVQQLMLMGYQPTGQVLTLLRKYMPLPADLAAQGLTEAQYYARVPQVSSPEPFDNVALTNELEATVFKPMNAVQPLFVSHPYLTRLATFISPDEMTKDPRFVTNADLPDVNPLHMAVAHLVCGDEDYSFCNAPVRLQLEDGSSVNYAAPAGGSCGGTSRTYDRGKLDQLPSGDIGYMRAGAGEGHVVVDQRAAIKAGLKAHNATVPLGSGGCGCAMRGRGPGRPLAVALVLSVAVGVLVRRRRR